VQRCHGPRRLQDSDDDDDSQHCSVPVPCQGKLGGLWQTGQLAWVTDSPDGMASRRIVGASASVIFPCTIKSRRWQAVVKQVDKGCCEFCVTVGTVTRTAGILIHGRLKALAVNLSQPSGQLWLHAG